MDTRRLIVALCASMAVFILWNMISVTLWPPEKPTTQPAASQPGGEGFEPARGSDLATRPARPAVPATDHAGPARIAPGPGGYTVRGGQDNTPVMLGGAEPDSRYPVALEIMPRGAAVAKANVRGHRESVKDKTPYRLFGPVRLPDADRDTAPFYSFVTPIIRFQNLDADLDLTNAVWALDPASDTEHKVFTVDVLKPNGDRLARIVKTYELLEQPVSDKPEERTFDLTLTLQIENVSGEAFTAILVQRGPIGFQAEDIRYEDRRVLGAVYAEGEVVTADHDRKSIFQSKQLIAQDNDEQRIAWAAVTNKYFAGIMAPAGRVDARGEPMFKSVETAHLTDVEKVGRQVFAEDMTFEMITVPLVIAPGDSRGVGFDCFLGPKSKSTFESVEVYRQRFYFGAIAEYFYACANEAISRGMMWLLDQFHRIPPHNYGLAIIVLVLVVRTLLHPITRKSQVGMLKMQKQMSTLQPKIQAVREKHANDKQAMNQAIMEVYREAGVNPAGNILSCLPMMLQIPIWAALWAALNSTVEMRHAPFDGWWIRDLAGQDALFTFGRPVNIPLVSLLTGPIYSFNLLPILLGLSQVLQAKFMPRGNTSAQGSKTPDQLEQQRKMMMFMSAFFVLILYNAPAGLNLYIMVSNFFGILEQWRIRKHLADVEAKQAEAPPPEKPKDQTGPKQPAPARANVDRRPPKKPGWLQKKWRGLEKQAEEARRIQSQKKKKARPR